MLTCFSLFYLRPDSASWSQLEQQATWQHFVATIQWLLQGPSLSGQFSLRCPQKERLSGKAFLSRWLFGKTDVVFNESEFLRPPSFTTQLDFARRHFVGGLPTSVLPIESLYRRWTQQKSASLPFAHQTGLYNGDAAKHMASLLKEFELDITEDSVSTPDHLAIELHFLILLIRHGKASDIRQFIDDHLSWLPDYVDALFDRVPDARMFIAITILLIACLEALRQKPQVALWQAEFGFREPLSVS
jgi:TorA maturation chaperone TorD